MSRLGKPANSLRGKFATSAVLFFDDVRRHSGLVGLRTGARHAGPRLARAHAFPPGGEARAPADVLALPGLLEVLDVRHPVDVRDGERLAREIWRASEPCVGDVERELHAVARGDHR